MTMLEAIITGFSTGIGVIFANYTWENYLKDKLDKTNKHIKRLTDFNGGDKNGFYKQEEFQESNK